MSISDWSSDVCSSDLLAIFLYVGAEVAIGTQMALFLNSASIWDIPLQHAGYYVSLYWLGAMIGRFVGSALLTRIKAHLLLAVNKSEEHTSELQSLMRISYAVFCLKKKKK